MSFFTGSPAIRENVSSLRKEQEPLYNQLTNAGQGRGAGGAFGTSADYYRDLLGNDSEDFNSFANPELRNFRENTIPGLSEQFAGFGSGGLDSSGFRNAAVNAGTDLSERLGAIRAKLRQQGAEGLNNIGQQGLNSFSQNMETQPGTPGLLSTLAPAIGGAIGSFGGPLGTALGGMAGSYLSNTFGQPKVGAKTGPYGNPQSNSGFSSQLPNFNPNIMKRF